MEKLDDFKALLDESVRFHGHLCAGQITGVKIAMAGLSALGFRDPRGKDRKNLVVFAEIDRCATDAIMSVTGSTPGKRSLKIVDYGKMAATFVDLQTNHAVRVSLRRDTQKAAEELGAAVAPEKTGQQAYMEGLMHLPDERLLNIQEVDVRIDPGDLPGPPARVAVCENCGETVLDMRDVSINDQVLCKPCAMGRAYYTPKSDA